MATVIHDLGRSMEVVQHSYRSAIVGDVFLIVPSAALRDFELALAQKAGARPDNHTVYTVTYKDGFGDEVTHIWFTDGKTIFGRKVHEGRF